MATKPFLSQIAVPVGTTTGDVYYPQTSLLMHFNGTNGSTTMTDNSKNNATVTAVGNAQLSTAQSKFGGTSLYLDGTGDRLTIASPTPDFSFGTDDFTIETWVYKTVASTAAVLDARATADAIPWIAIINSSNFPYFYDGTQYVSTVPITLNSWVHLAWVRTSGVLKIFVNGIQGYSAAYTVNLNRTAGLIIGDTLSGNAYAGYIDELRITKGIARYTSNFTPQTTQFLDSAGDANSSVVVNSTATGFAIGTGGINGAQLAKAWVNFDGIGVVYIRDSYNVSSITDVGTGSYRVNYSSTFSTIPSVVASASNTTVNTNFGINVNSHTTSTVQIFCTENGVATDKGIVSVIVFSN